MERTTGAYEWIKGVITEIKYLLYVLFMYLDIDTDIFKILIWFMILDTIAGSLKVIKIDESKFRFKILLWGIVSKLGILIIPLTVALLFKGIGKDLGFSVILIVKILIVSEFISFISNIYTIRTGKVVKDIDIFTMLFKFLRCKALEILSIYTEKQIKDEDCTN